jgi:hypothetical protein
MSPLVYIFAGAAAVLALVFVASALLIYRHARTRSKRASELNAYLRDGGETARPISPGLRSRVMQVTIGDLVRDDRLAFAAVDGAIAAAEKRWTPVVGRFYRIDRTESGGYLADVRLPGRPAVRAAFETEAEARAWAEKTVANFTSEG